MILGRSGFGSEVYEAWRLCLMMVLDGDDNKVGGEDVKADIIYPIEVI